MSKSSARQRASARRRKRRRRTQIQLIIGVVVGAVILTGALILISAPRAQSLEPVADYSEFTQEIDRSGAVGFAIGEPDAPVTMVEYSDFSCPHCHDLAAIVDRLIEEYVSEGKLRIVFKPVSFVNPPYSTPAAQAALCAAEQGKFWEMHAQIWALYETRGPTGYTRPNLVAQATAIGLDQDQFERCYSSAETRTAIEGVLEETRALGIAGTPTIYVNDQQVGYTGADTFYDRMVQVIELELGG
ncbi:MAG TPA: hypothetical protein ENI95_04940 [Chloroflexi bacterium]|nr:hypothetical protein [Chloroflexota bacterium]